MDLKDTTSGLIQKVRGVVGGLHERLGEEIDLEINIAEDADEAPKLPRSTEPQGQPAEVEKISFGDYIRELHDPNVISESGSEAIVNLSTLHVLVLHELQKDLVECALKYKDESLDTRELVGITHQYVEALKDWDYIRSCSSPDRPHDPFILTTHRIVDCTLVEKIVHDSNFAQNIDDTDKIAQLTRNFTTSHKARDIHAPGKWKIFGGSRNLERQNISQAQKAAEDREWWINFSRRMGMAFGGGAFLIAPMLIMVLHQSKTTSLVTASVFVFAFGVVMAVALEKRSEFDVLTATAAYAAVLVVFVGSSGGA